MLESWGSAKILAYKQGEVGAASLRVSDLSCLLLSLPFSVYVDRLGPPPRSFWGRGFKVKVGSYRLSTKNNNFNKKILVERERGSEEESNSLPNTRYIS